MVGAPERRSSSATSSMPRSVSTPIENCQFGGGAHFCLGYHMALLEGTIFLVHAARSLVAWGRRPHLRGAMPKPVHLPLTQPPASAELGLV